MLRAGVVPNTKASEEEAVVPPEVAAEEEEERELGEEAELVAAEEEDPCSTAMAQDGAEAKNWLLIPSWKEIGTTVFAVIGKLPSVQHIHAEVQQNARSMWHAGPGNTHDPIYKDGIHRYKYTWNNTCLTQTSGQG